MSWNEELNTISIGTLFKLFGKLLVASILWLFIFYAIMMIPMMVFFALFPMYF